MNDLEAAIHAVKNAPQDGSVLVCSPTGIERWHVPTCDYVQKAMLLGEQLLAGDPRGKPFRWKTAPLSRFDLRHRGGNVICGTCPDTEKAPSQLAQKVAQRVQVAAQATGGKPVTLADIEAVWVAMGWQKSAIPIGLEEARRKGLIVEHRSWSLAPDPS